VIPVAVVGAGNMGSNHIRVFDELNGANLVEVVEPDPDRAGEVAAEYDVAVHETVEDLSRAKAVTIAVPSVHHREVTNQCLDAGLDVLVEKPLATTVEDAQAIVDRARETDAILQVGHIERFNPAVETLLSLLDGQEVVAVEAHRLGPFNDHLSEENVIFDLMIHDLDIVDTVVDGEVTEIKSMRTTALSEETDHAVALLKFDSGPLASVTASHITHSKVRRLDVTTTDAYITLNYQKQDIVVQRHGTEETTLLLSRGGYRTETITESPYVQTCEPLKNQLNVFLECVRKREIPPVPGDDGLRAVKLATRVSST
jgi:predicted dehydrogenase